jgi:hypothetical protein
VIERVPETRLTIVSISSPPPESASSAPIIAPSATSRPTLLTVLPTPFVKMSMVPVAPKRGRDPQDGGAEDQGQERMHLDDDDEHDDDGDPEQRGDEELRRPGLRFIGGDERRQFGVRGHRVLLWRRTRPAKGR